MGERIISERKLEAMRFARKRWELYGAIGRLRWARSALVSIPRLFIEIDHPGVVSASNALLAISNIEKQIDKEINRLNQVQARGDSFNDY